jgi:hypothetical protein
MDITIKIHKLQFVGPPLRRLHVLLHLQRTQAATFSWTALRLLLWHGRTIRLPRAVLREDAICYSLVVMVPSLFSAIRSLNVATFRWELLSSPRRSSLEWPPYEKLRLFGVQDRQLASSSASTCWRSCNQCGWCENLPRSCSNFWSVPVTARSKS